MRCGVMRETGAAYLSRTAQRLLPALIA